MEENNNEVQQPEEVPADDRNHPIRGIVFTALVVWFVYIFATKVLLPRLHAADHSPTKVLNEATSEVYINEIIGK